MTDYKRMMLESEIDQITKLLSEIPVQAEIERDGLQQRLDELTEKLSKMPLETIRPVTRLLFRGEQVDGSHGIFANFGTRAAKSFADAYSTVVAGLKDNLRYMGPIPERGNHELLITGTAIGSFGFQLELPSVEPDLLFDGETLEESALKRMRDLMEVSAYGTDDEISEIVEKIHPRAVRKISDFLSYVASSNTTPAIEINGAFFRYPDVDVLADSVRRLQEENIRESREVMSGAFIGVLPKARQFEFKTVADDIYRGKISSDIEEPESVTQLIGELHSVEFSVIQVGQGRPRYTLERLEDIRTFEG